MRSPQFEKSLIHPYCSFEVPSKKDMVMNDKKLCIVLLAI